MIEVAELRMLDGAEPGWERALVAGLPLVDRQLMTLKQAGLVRVWLVVPDPSSTWARALRDQAVENPRMPQIVLADPLEEHNLVVPRVILDGRYLVHPEAIRHASEQRNATVYLDGQGRAAGLQVAGEEEAAEQIRLPARLFCERIDSRQNRGPAERALFRSLIKPEDGWCAVNLNRPISLAISRRLARTQVHPNLVTAMTLAVGLASGGLSLLGTWFWLAMGGILYHLASVLDGVDGEIARVNFLGSSLGQWLDTVSDDLTTIAYLIGLTWGLSEHVEARQFIWFGWAAVGLHLSSRLLLYWQLATRFNSGQLLHISWDFRKPKEENRSAGQRIQAKLEPFFKRDFYALAFGMMAVAGLAHWILPVAAVALLGTTLAIGVQIVKWRSRERSQVDGQAASI